MNWEYREEVLPDDPHDRNAALSSAGSFGWELVSVVTGVAYLKRPMKEPDWDAFFQHSYRMMFDSEYYLQRMDRTRQEAERYYAAKAAKEGQ